MKRFCILLTMMFFGFIGLQAQGPFIKFDKLVHDFGNLVQGDKAECEFVFTNTGDAPLLLSNVRSTCGCTVPSWTKEPIMPGQKGTIKIKYDSNRVGPINKQITVESNGTNGQVFLKIVGNIDKKPTEIMPIQDTDPDGMPFAH